MLEIEHLSAGYGRIRALSGVSLSVAQGEIVALVGSNGAGKTTLMKAIAGVHPVASGRITFKQRDITRLPAHRRVGAGLVMVPEGRQLFGPLTVRDNLALGAYRAGREGRGTIAAGIDEAFALFPDLGERRHALAATLSGGQQQMLAVARALMARPACLLLDEPSMGLAPLLVRQILAAVESLRGRGMTIFLVEQNAVAALEIADRGYLIETGRVVRTGPGRALLDDKAVREAYLGL